MMNLKVFPQIQIQFVTTAVKKKEKKSDAKKKLEEAKKSDESWFTKFENALVSFKTKISNFWEKAKKFLLCLITFKDAVEDGKSWYSKIGSLLKSVFEKGNIYFLILTQKLILFFKF